MENSFLPVILSSKFRDILLKINDNVSLTILNLENNADFVSAFSYLDITDDNGGLSFLPAKKFNQLPRERGMGDLPWTCAYRNIMKVGRVVNKLAPFYSQAEIEKWVNSFKSEHKNILNRIKFKIIEGDDIVKFYNARSYARGNGALNKSCMRHDACENYMKIYSDNPDNIKMLILFEERDRISGRALLWKLDDPENTWFMDRIYAKEDSDVLLFKKFAEKKGWLYKNTQTYDAINVVRDGFETYIDMKINIKAKNYRHFPYLDTLQFFNTKFNYLTNSEKDYKENPYTIKLREINGNDSGNEFFVEDIVNKDMIPIEDAVYCYFGDGYTHRNSAIFLSVEDEYAILSQVRFSDYENRMVTLNGSVFSHKLNSFVSKPLVKKVYLDKNTTTWDYLLLKDKYSSVGGVLFVDDILVKGLDGTIYFKEDYNEVDDSNRLKEQADIVETIMKSDAIDKLKGFKSKKKNNFFDFSESDKKNPKNGYGNFFSLSD